MPAFTAEPPPTKQGKYDRKPWPEHVKIVKALKAKSGEWANVKTFTSSTAAAQFAANVRHNRYLAFREGHYEATVRGLDVYARFVGE